MGHGVWWGRAVPGLRFEGSSGSDLGWEWQSGIGMDGIKSICKMVRRFGWSSMEWKARAGYGQRDISLSGGLSGQIYLLRLCLKWLGPSLIKVAANEMAGIRAPQF